MRPQRRARLPIASLVLLLAWGIPIRSAPRDEASPAGGEPSHESARWIDDSGLRSPGFGRVTFVAANGREIGARVYRSASFDPATGRIWFVMHGADRDVERYIRAAAPSAERYDALAIAIHFSKEAFPEGSDYTLAPANYQEVERVFGAVRGSLGGRQPGYYLFGHSAGAQFTHRLLTFSPRRRVLAAVAANAGWYTLPTDEHRRDHLVPYGLRGASVDREALARLFGTPLVVLLGEDDTAGHETDPLVRDTPEAVAQGANRLERGRHYFEVARARAAALKSEFAWRLVVLPRVGHDAAGVIDSAAFLTFEGDGEPCAPSAAGEAAGLVITEILADPPLGAAGDANGDGVRDPQGDEFVELVHRGTETLCLSGWTLGDSRSRVRHVFPAGSSLAPGQVLVVFGGGVPTGRFDGARVQWAEGGLSLTNDGDVIVLRDRTDAIVSRISWGEVDAAERAGDHWPEGLGIRGSIRRAQSAAPRWEVHPELRGSRFSPGRVPERED